ncbi:hypothetical protein KUCAC02_005659, partial [Chaenocephalus aceratus]
YQLLCCLTEVSGGSTLICSPAAVTCHMTCVVPLTSKSQRDATRGEVSPSVELVREWILPHCGSATGNSRQAGRQLLSSSPPTASGSRCAASALP